MTRALTQRLRTRTGTYITKFFHAVALFHEPDTRIQSASVGARHGMIAEDVLHFSLLQFKRTIESLLHSSNRWELMLATLVRCISAQMLVRVITTTHGFAYLLRLFNGLGAYFILVGGRTEQAFSRAASSPPCCLPSMRQEDFLNMDGQSLRASSCQSNTPSLLFLYE